MHQCGGDRLPSLSASLLPEPNEAVLGIEVLERQMKQTASATDCFDEHTQNQGIDQAPIRD